MTDYNQFTLTLPSNIPYPVIVGTSGSFAASTALTSKTFEGSRAMVRETLEEQVRLNSSGALRAAAVLERFEMLYVSPPTPFQVLKSNEVALADLFFNFHTEEPSKVYINEDLVVSWVNGADCGALRLDMLARGGVQLGFSPEAEVQVHRLLLSVGFTGPFTTLGVRGGPSLAIRVPHHQLLPLRRQPEAAVQNAYQGTLTRIDAESAA